MRKLSGISRNSVIRLASITAAGSGLLYAHNYEARITIRAPFRELLPLPWPIEETIPPRPLFFKSDRSQCGLPLFSFSAGLSPSADEKGASGGRKDGSKCCSRCFGRDTIANAATKVGPAVVNISIRRGIYGIGTGKGIGSGTIIDKDGTILTCAHAVVDFHGGKFASKGKVDVTLQDGRTFEGTVVNADLHSDTAIIKINSKTPLPTAKLGSSSKLQPGDWVIAVGCPLSLQNTVTAAMTPLQGTKLFKFDCWQFFVEEWNNCVDHKSSDLGLGGIRREYLQTDCAINPGNSGGPLVNIDGEVVGVNIMKVLAADGLSFSVPIDSVIKIIDHFKRRGRVVRPWLGLKMIDLNEMIIEQLKERHADFPNVKKGILVAMVTPGSPAERAGFQPGDVVIEFNGESVESIKEVIERMSDRVGEAMKAVVKREGDKTVTLTVIPEDSNPDM